MTLNNNHIGKPREQTQYFQYFLDKVLHTDTLLNKQTKINNTVIDWVYEHTLPLRMLQANAKMESTFPFCTGMSGRKKRIENKENEENCTTTTV